MIKCRDGKHAYDIKEDRSTDSEPAPACADNQKTAAMKDEERKGAFPIEFIFLGKDRLNALRMIITVPPLVESGEKAPEKAGSWFWGGISRNGIHCCSFAFWSRFDSAADSMRFLELGEDGR